MPFANEIEGVWWMGSYEGRFDEVLLMCGVGGEVAAPLAARFLNALP